MRVKLKLKIMDKVAFFQLNDNQTNSTITHEIVFQ